MRKRRIEEAVGMVLAHDMTEIVPGEYKKAAFKKGHVIRKEDIPKLLNMGKEHIYIFELGEKEIHENDAAVRMAKAAAGQGIELTEPSEGKVSMIAMQDGLLRINVKALLEINELEDIMMSTLHTNRVVEKGTVIGGTRIIPLVTDKGRIEKVEDICRDSGFIAEVKPMTGMKVGIVTTGSEVYHHRIKDKFGPVIKEKVKAFGCEVVDQILVNDNAMMIKRAIDELRSQGAELIACTGGMSVDPDDVTPSGIRLSGAEIVTYGAPVLPGAMFMLAYLDDMPIVGLPGCVMYSKRTVFDLVLPRLLAGEKLTRKDIVLLGHGGLCSRCDVCTFPNCGFGSAGC